MNTLLNIDCMDYMKTCSNNQFDLAIVDPPYGIGAGGGIGGDKLATVKRYKNGGWDNSISDKKYFDELLRVTKNQIIWGGNYFLDYLSNTSCMIVWDKKNGSNYFADCELAWTSFNTAVRKYEFMWQGMLQENMKNKEFRIHPTQKPIALYKWLLTNYAKPRNKLIDTHSGSGSFRIAAYDMGFDLDSCEKDPDHYRDNKARYRNHVQQMDLFKPSEIQKNIYAQPELI